MKGKNHTRRNKTREVRKARKELDAMARQEVFERDGHKCVRCSESRTIQWAHIFSRRHPALRWESDNALTMCAGCHMWWHHSPLLAVEWFRANWPDRYRRIMAVYQVNPKVNPIILLSERQTGNLPSTL